MELKIISFNIHKGIGWRTRKSTINEITQQIDLINPDIIFFQEIRGYQLNEFVKNEWTHHCYGKNVISMQGDYGNAIISKYPIIFTSNLDLSINNMEKRGLLHVIINLKDTKIHLLCVHLGLFKKDRLKQLDKITEYVLSTIPPKEPLILGGDFNDWNDHANSHLLKTLQLSEVFLHLYGEYAKTFPAWAPLLKLDRIYYRFMHAEKAYRIIQTPWKLLSDHIAIHASLLLNENVK